MRAVISVAIFITLFGVAIAGEQSETAYKDTGAIKTALKNNGVVIKANPSPLDQYLAQANKMDQVWGRLAVEAESEEVFREQARKGQLTDEQVARCLKVRTDLREHEMNYRRKLEKAARLVQRLTQNPAFNDIAVKSSGTNSLKPETPVSGNSQGENADLRETFKYGIHN